MEKATRKELFRVAKDMARAPFHGTFDGLPSNLAPIVRLFPTWSVKEADGLWCAAFVYYCCTEAGFEIPYRPNECKTCHLAACFGWEEFAGRNLPSTISGLNTIEARKSLFRKRETLSFMTEYSRTESTIIWGSSLRNGSIRLLPRKEILTTSPESLSDQSTDISGRIFEFRMDINTVRQSDRFKFIGLMP